MSEDTRSRSGCWRCGCWGCLAVVVGGILLLVVMGVAQYARQRGEAVVEEVTSDRALPTVADLEALRRAGEIGGPTRLPDAEDSAGVAVGTVELDLGLGEFEIVAGPPGSGVEVSGTYEPDAFNLREELEQRDDGSWTYRLSFRPRGGMLGMMFTGAGNDPQNRLRISLPPDKPFDLVGEWGVGEVHAELGGLWLRTVDLEIGTGGHSVSFSTPTVQPVGEVRLRKSIGELEVDQLGNASPASAVITQRIGELRVDLDGAWIADADLTLRNRLGELDVDAPRGARIEVSGEAQGLVERRIDLPDESALPDDAPLLRLDLSAQVGEVRVDPPRRGEDGG
ncbi:MAG: hypothetical protein DWQ36_17325 [Acidobacteria bacterium]|nr:MAG: hypothetical protein DWQ30_05420 [Acidobacteriota bacterium]REK04607.1 MAG: hypothetical protein DWQ36_17325 [Acidobacteriota bacterium]